MLNINKFVLWISSNCTVYSLLFMWIARELVAPVDALCVIHDLV